MRVHWTVLESDNAHVEAQVWEPDTATRRAILFCPGFPGAGATIFEQRHAATIAEAGYALIVLRHAGTRLDGPHAPSMVNNGARLAQGRTRGDTHLGGGPATIDGWLIEPLTALRALAGRYDDIYVIGNSFGALSSLWSLTDPAAPLDNVRHVLLQAGAQGTMDTMRIWIPEFIGMSRVTERVSLNDPKDIADTLKFVYERLPARVRALPERIGLSAIVVARDEILKLSDAEGFNDAIGGRCRIVVDEIDQPYHQHNLMAHDMPDYPTAMLLDLLT